MNNDNTLKNPTPVPNTSNDTPAYKRSPTAKRPGPYCTDTATEIIIAAPYDDIHAWVIKHLGELMPIKAGGIDFIAKTEDDGWTTVHLINLKSMVYFGLEDTPSQWPSSRHLAQALANDFKVTVIIAKDQKEIVDPEN